MGYKFIKGSCEKSELYDMLINAMLAEGWENITSNYITDGDVMYSTGKNGDKKICIRLFPYFAGTTNAVITEANEKTYSTRTTGAYSMGIQLQKNYTPGSTGEAGVFSDPTRYIMCFTTMTLSTNAAILPDILVEYYLYVDKSKVIIFTKFPTSDWVMTYMGLADTLYSKCDEGRGTMFISTNFAPYYTGGYIGEIPTAGQILMSEYPDEGGGITLNVKKHYVSNCAYINPLISPNRNDQYFLSELYVQSAQYGTIAKLDGIWGTGAENLNSGDTITVGDKKYLVFKHVAATVYPVLNVNSYCATVNNIGLTGIVIEVL